MADADIALARAYLEAAKRRLDAELADYPRPVSGCDVQLTHLLAERRRVSIALDALSRPVAMPTPRNLDAVA